MSALAVTAVGLAGVGCGYSQEEWDQKVRELEHTQNQLSAQRLAHKKCERDQSDALAEVEDLKKKLRDRGLNVDNLDKRLRDSVKAMELHQRQVEQIGTYKVLYESLRESLAGFAKDGVEVVVQNNRVKVRVPSDLLFDKDDTLLEEGRNVLAQLATVIREDKALAERQFQVAVHTDSSDLGPAVKFRFKDNWGLSAMRGRSVLAFLLGETPKGGGLKKDQWSAAGYADSQPLQKNDTDEHKKANRRVELVLLPTAEEMLRLESIASE